MMIVGGILIALVLLIGLYVATTWAPELTVQELRPRFASPSSAFLNVAGMKVHMRDEGPRDDPSPIVLLHGTAASLHTWDGWAEALKSSRRVIRFDLPGFGLTGPSPDRNYSIHNAIRLLIAMLDHLGIERADYIISGIPYSTIPVPLRRRILRESRAMATEGGEVIVYQFMRSIERHLRDCFDEVEPDFEALNLPPARVWYCK